MKIDDVILKEEGLEFLKDLGKVGFKAFDYSFRFIKIDLYFVHITFQNF